LVLGGLDHVSFDPASVYSSVKLEMHSKYCFSTTSFPDISAVIPIESHFHCFVGLFRSLYPHYDVASVFVLTMKQLSFKCLGSFSHNLSQRSFDFPNQLSARTRVNIFHHKFQLLSFLKAVIHRYRSFEVRIELVFLHFRLASQDPFVADKLEY
jgi:hypothetical protein